MRPLLDLWNLAGNLSSQASDEDSARRLCLTPPFVVFFALLVEGWGSLRAGAVRLILWN